jgi:hypothetical protein
MAQKLAAALASGLAAAALAVVALVANMIKAPPLTRTSISGPLGSGPHGTHPCAPDAERVAVFCQMAQQLREAAKEEHWTLDWAGFNAHGEHAHAALVAGDYRQALREYALAIMFMMNQIRHQATRRNHRDSSVLDM